jgi:hypothetical protein
MDDSEPNVGYMAANAAKLAGGGIGILQALILVVLATYELPVAMLTRTNKGARYARLLRLLIGLFVGSLFYAAFDPLSESFGIVGALGPDSRDPYGPSLFFALSVFSLGAYAVALVRRWRREKRRQFVHSQFIGFPRFFPLAYRSYLIEPVVVAGVGTLLIVARVSYPFGLYLGSVAAVMLLQFAVLMARRRNLILDLRDAELVQHGLRHVDPTNEVRETAEASTPSDELMRVFRMR